MMSLDIYRLLQMSLAFVWNLEQSEIGGAGCAELQ